MHSVHTYLLQTIRSMVALSEDEETLIKELFTERQTEKNDFFLREGKVCREIGFINAGLVRYFIIKDGEELIYDFSSEGHFICNYESFLNHSLSLKNIQFIEDTSWLSLSYDKLQTFYQKIEQGEKFGRLICEQIFVDALRKITSLYTDAPEQRYQQFISLYPDLQQRVPQYFVSSFVGVKPQSLSRIRRRLALR